MLVEEKIRNYKSPIQENAANQGIPSFLLKTYQILQNHHYSDIICWTKNGQGFVIKKIKEFAQKIIPMHFRHSNYTSFVRQLNMYDFHKTRQENQENGFKNSMFRRGRKHLLKEIERKDYKKKKQKPENNQKTYIKISQNDEQEIKKTKNERQFYEKNLNMLQKIDKEMNMEQNLLAKIDNVTSSDECVSEILDILFKVKNMNNSWMNKVSNMNKQWQSMIKIKRDSITHQIEAQREGEKKEQGPTIPTMKSLINH